MLSSSDSPVAASTAPKESTRGFFLVVLLLNIGVAASIFSERRIPCGHDGFQHYSAQYYFLNNAVTAGEIPQWMPFMMQGMVSNWWYVGQAEFTQAFFLLAGKVMSGMNFLQLYYIGFCFDELLLLVGVWLLAQRYFTDPATRCFVALTVAGSSIWTGPPGFNFFFYYAMPLVLHYLHEFLETGKWRKAFLCGNLYVIQMMGNGVYFLPVTSLTIFAYLLTYCLLHTGTVRHQILAIRRPWHGLATLLLVMAGLAVVYLAQAVGTESILNYGPGRGMDSKVPVIHFLTYGVGRNYEIWKELAIGFGPAIDYTLYFGILSVAFIVLGLACSFRKESAPFWTPVLLLFFFSLGGVVSFLCYSFWPMMKYYRHLTYVLPLAKLFLCFLAGFGFEAVVIKPLRRKCPLAIGVVALGLCSLWLFSVSCDPDSADRLWNSMLSSVLGYKKLNAGIHVALLQLGVASALCAAILLLLIMTSRVSRPLVVLLALALQAADLYGHKLLAATYHTFPAKEAQYRMNEFRAAPYAARRGRPENQNPRAVAFDADILKRSYTVNWSVDSFLFQDSLNQRFRVDHWLKPLDDFMRAYWRQPLDRPDIRPSGLTDFKGLTFPSSHPAALKLAGVTEDKLQVFGDAYEVNSTKALAALITDDSYRGDILFVSRPTTVDGSIQPAKPWDGRLPLSASTRLAARCHVVRFDANNLALEVQTPPTTMGTHAWLMYSDVWHPFWRATVNGKPAEVWKAALAYKAVCIPYGRSEVRFTFGSTRILFLHWLIGLNALFWIGTVVYLAARCVGRNAGVGFGQTVLCAGDAELNKVVSPLPCAPWKGLLSRKLGPGLALALALVWLWGARDRVLMVAAGNGHTPLVRLLMGLGADVNARDGAGMTSLMFAAKSGKADIVRMLLQHQADPNWTGDDSKTAITYAAANGNVQIVSMLLAHDAYVGANLTISSAFANGHTNLVKYLLYKLPQRSDDAALVDKEGRTPLAYGVLAGNQAVVKHLLEKGFPPDTPDQAGAAPLMYAAHAGNVPVLKLLLQWGANVNGRDKAGWSALMVATAGGQLDAMRTLIAGGADLTLKDANGLSALEIARMQGQTDAARLLQEAAARK
ncbi:MAG: ankyrin repeat domain-containing protein [Verrucomicrobia bacterium]|nr:ankyrin repeat domain-containing protein [Verrucomicrobiota bacterium]